MCSSIHCSSISSCSGLKPTAPSTPNPPAFATATTTSRQCVKAKIGNSMPRSSQIGVRMVGLLGRGGSVGVVGEEQAGRRLEVVGHLVLVQRATDPGGKHGEPHVAEGAHGAV